MKRQPQPTAEQRERWAKLQRMFCDYEIASSWWAGWIGIGPLQSIVAWHYSCKVQRKMRRYHRYLNRARKYAGRRAG